MKYQWKIALAFVLIVGVVVVFAASNPRTVDVTETVHINADRSEIWDAVTDFEGVFNDSNPVHYETVITSSPKRPFRRGLIFRQEETVGGLRGILDGEVFDVKDRYHYRWKASTEYFVGDWSFITVDEGGEVRIVEASDERYRLVPRVYGRFPDTIWGRMLSWFSSAVMGMESDAASHTLTLLEYVKNWLESGRHE